MSWIINHLVKPLSWEALTAIGTIALVVVPFITSNKQVKTLEKQLNKEKKQKAHDCVNYFHQELRSLKDGKFLSNEEIESMLQKFISQVHSIKYSTTKEDYEQLLTIIKMTHPYQSATFGLNLDKARDKSPWERSEEDRNREAVLSEAYRTAYFELLASTSKFLEQSR